MRQSGCPSPTPAAAQHSKHCHQHDQPSVSRSVGVSHVQSGSRGRHTWMVLCECTLLGELWVQRQLAKGTVCCCPLHVTLHPVLPQLARPCHLGLHSTQHHNPKPHHQQPQPPLNNEPSSLYPHDQAYTSSHARGQHPHNLKPVTAQPSLYPNGQARTPPDQACTPTKPSHLQVVGVEDGHVCLQDDPVGLGGAVKGHAR